MNIKRNKEKEKQIIINKKGTPWSISLLYNYSIIFMAGRLSSQFFDSFIK